MADVYFDIETRGSVDLTKVGKYNYFKSTGADLLMIAYRVGLNDSTKVWLPSELPPEVFLSPQTHTFHAFNILFDKAGINILGGTYGLGKIKIHQCRDVQALVLRYGLPKSLNNAAKVILKSDGKLKSGKRLMTKITMPPWEYTQDEFNEFIEYCVHDVDLMCDIVQHMPTEQLDEYEQKIWQNTAEINSRGVPVDIISAQRVYAIVQEYIKEEIKIVPILTDGALKSVSQVIALKNYINNLGGNLPDTSKVTLRNLMDQDPPPEWMTPELKLLIEMRQLFGSTSIAKYKKIISQYHKGRIYDNINYFGAHTGRETGEGFQIHNLPRASVKDPDAEIQKFFDLSILEKGSDPVYSAKALIRPMIKAPRNKILGVWDYKAIENRLLYWFAKDTIAMEKIKSGKEEYVEFASLLYHVPEEEVTKEQRNFGKAVALGGGYGLSANGLVDLCDNWGLRVDASECEEAINLYRNIHPLVKAQWYRLANAAKRVMRLKESRVEQDGCVFIKAKDRIGNEWLIIRLPSERNIYYSTPSLEIGNYGEELRHWGVDGETKKWVKKKLYHGKIIENIIQALARDVLMEGRKRVIDAEYKVIASVHDENIAELDYGNHKEEWNKVKALMEVPPYWLRDMPLVVDGYTSRRYKKD